LCAPLHLPLRLMGHVLALRARKAALLIRGPAVGCATPNLADMKFGAASSFTCCVAALCTIWLCHLQSPLKRGGESRVVENSPRQRRLFERRRFSDFGVLDLRIGGVLPVAKRDEALCSDGFVEQLVQLLALRVEAKMLFEEDAQVELRPVLLHRVVPVEHEAVTERDVAR